MAAKTGSERDPGVDFTKFQTYAWKNAEGPSAPDVDGRIRKAANEELKKKGLRLAAEGEKPDLQLQYNAGFADTLVAGFSVTAGWWGDLVAIPGAETNVRAGIVFLFTRPDDGEGVWTGWLVQEATTENALPILRDRAPKYAKRVLAKYPK
jgi:hypothetical protein